MGMIKNGYQPSGIGMKKKNISTIEFIVKSKFFSDLLDTGLLDEAEIILMLQKQDFLKDESRIEIAEAVFDMVK